MTLFVSQMAPYSLSGTVILTRAHRSLVKSSALYGGIRFNLGRSHSVMDEGRGDIGWEGQRGVRREEGGCIHTHTFCFYITRPFWSCRLNKPSLHVFILYYEDRTWISYTLKSNKQMNISTTGSSVNRQTDRRTARQQSANDNEDWMMWSTQIFFMWKCEKIYFLFHLFHSEKDWDTKYWASSHQTSSNQTSDIFPSSKRLHKLYGEKNRPSILI